MPDDPPTTGFVAIGRNEGRRLVRCLRSLREAGCPIVYVDSGSVDGSPAAAAGVGAAVVPLAPDRPFTAARARAEGAALLQSRYPDLQYIMFIDGDCELEPAFLPAALRFMADNGDVAAVCGRRRERLPEASPYNRLIDSEWDTPVGEAQACGGDALFRAQSYFASGGFDPEMLAGEEPELCSRMRAAGWRIVRIDAPMTLHDAALHHIGQWWARAVRSGMGYAQAFTKTRSRPEGPLYARQIARAAGWAAFLPLGSMALAALVSPLFLAVWPVAAAAQFLRLAAREGTICRRPFRCRKVPGATRDCPLHRRRARRRAGPRGNLQVTDRRDKG